MDFYLEKTPKQHVLGSMRENDFLWKQSFIGFAKAERRQKTRELCLLVSQKDCRLRSLSSLREYWKGF